MSSVGRLLPFLRCNPWLRETHLGALCNFDPVARDAEPHRWRPVFLRLASRVHKRHHGIIVALIDAGAIRDDGVPRVHMHVLRVAELQHEVGVRPELIDVVAAVDLDG